MNKMKPRARLAFSFSIWNCGATEAKIRARKMRQKIRIAAEKDRNEIGVGKGRREKMEPTERETEGCR